MDKGKSEGAGLSRAKVVAMIDEEIAHLEGELRVMYQARSTLLEASEASTRQQTGPRAKRRTRKAAATAKRTPAKASSARRPKKSTTKRRSKLQDDAPVVRKGRAPRVGVQQQVCETLTDRQAKVRELKASGYERVGVHGRVTAGTFDVRPSGDGGESVVVLWKEKEVAGE